MYRLYHKQGKDFHTFKILKYRLEIKIYFNYSMKNGLVAYNYSMKNSWWPLISLIKFRYKIKFNLKLYCIVYNVLQSKLLTDHKDLVSISHMTTL